MFKKPLLIFKKTYSEDFIIRGTNLEKSVVKKLIVEKDCEMLPKNLQIIFANKMNGKIISLSFDKNSTIFNAKISVQKKTLLKFEEFYLEFHGEHLNNEKTMDDYQIVDKSMINIIGGLKGGKKIKIKTVNGNLFEIEISDNETVMNLKSKIKTKINLSEYEQDLHFDNKKLKNSEIIENLKIKEGSVVNCAYKNVDIEIVINMLGNQIYTLKVKNYEKVKDIKKKFNERTGKNIDNNRIIHGIDDLHDNETLDSYDVGNGSILMVIAVVNGGEFIEELLK